MIQIRKSSERGHFDHGYEQKAFSDDEKRGRLRLIASRDGREGSVTIHQDTDLYATILKPGEKAGHSLKPGRHAWVQVVRGEILLNGQDLWDSDGAAVSGENSAELTAKTDAEVLVFDLP